MSTSLQYLAGRVNSGTKKREFYNNVKEKGIECKHPNIIRFVGQRNKKKLRGTQKIRARVFGVVAKTPPRRGA